MLTFILVGLLLIVLGCALVQYLPFIPANLKQLLMLVIVIIGIIVMLQGTGVFSGKLASSLTGNKNTMIAYVL